MRVLKYAKAKPRNKKKYRSGNGWAWHYKGKVYTQNKKFKRK